MLLVQDKLVLIPTVYKNKNKLNTNSFFIKVVLNFHFKTHQSNYKKKIADKIVNTECIKQKKPSKNPTNNAIEIENLKKLLDQEKLITSDLRTKYSKLDSEMIVYKQDNDDLVKKFKLLESELQNREYQIQIYHDEIAYLNVKLNQYQIDKKIFQENIIALEDQLVYEHERYTHSNETKKELEKTLIETEKNLDIQKSNNSNLTKIKQKLEDDLRIAQKLKEENDSFAKRRENDINSLINELEEERCNCQKANKNVKTLEENLNRVKNEMNEKSGLILSEELQQVGNFIFLLVLFKINFNLFSIES